MEYHQKIQINKIKSGLLDICLNGFPERSYLDWYKLIDDMIRSEFNLAHTRFFIYQPSSNTFIPIEYFHKDAKKDIKKIKQQLHEIPMSDKPLTLTQLKTMGYSFVDDFVLFQNEEDEPIALLMVGPSSSKWKTFATSAIVEEFNRMITQFIVGIQQLNNLLSEGEKFKILFNITETFTSTMTSDSILDQMLMTVKKILPTAQKQLILSREQPEMKHDYMIFNQTDCPASVISSFLSGAVTTEENDQNNTITMNTPVTGHQGVYGVLRITLEEKECFDSTQRTLIQMLVHTAGNALENASLYKQSFQLNEDLKLINETSQKLNSGLNLDEMLSYLKQQINKTIQSDEVFFLIGDLHSSYALKESSDQFNKVDQKQIYMDYIIEAIGSDAKTLFNANFEHKSIVNPAYKSIMAIPILNQDEIIGAVICLHQEKYAFSFNNFKLIESLIIHASLSISNLQLRERMRELAEKDYLTGLYTRRYLEKHIHQILEQKMGGALLLFDIDDFKQVNDKYGHDVGDRVLIQVGRYLLENAQEGIIHSRWGGEEFAIYFPVEWQASSEKMSRDLLQRIPEVTHPTVTVSMGLIAWEEWADCNFEQIFKKVDHLLYEVKAKGKNSLLMDRNFSYHA